MSLFTKYDEGDIVLLVDGKTDLWRVEKITFWKDPKSNWMHPYYHLRNIVTDETCQELDNTIRKKDEGANLLYE